MFLVIKPIYVYVNFASFAGLWSMEYVNMNSITFGVS